MELPKSTEKIPAEKLLSQKEAEEQLKRILAEKNLPSEPIETQDGGYMSIAILTKRSNGGHLQFPSFYIKNYEDISIAEKNLNLAKKYYEINGSLLTSLFLRREDLETLEYSYKESANKELKEKIENFLIQLKKDFGEMTKEAIEKLLEEAKTFIENIKDAEELLSKQKFFLKLIKKCKLAKIDFFTEEDAQKKSFGDYADMEKEITEKVNERLDNLVLELENIIENFPPEDERWKLKDNREKWRYISRVEKFFKDRVCYTLNYEIHSTFCKKPKMA